MVFRSYKEIEMFLCFDSYNELVANSSKNKINEDELKRKAKHVYFNNQYSYYKSLGYDLDTAMNFAENDLDKVCKNE